MNREQLYASFLLDRQTGLEIALQADWVIEATSVTPIQPLPTSVDFLEGIMQLRDDVIPVVNLKRRFGLSSYSYNEDAKVAVVSLQARRYGLLFDDIKEVLRVPDSCVDRLGSVLMTEESIISDLIKLDQGGRTLELLDLKKLFPAGRPEAPDRNEIVSAPSSIEPGRYCRYVVFDCGGQEYGIPVEDSREICFLSDIDETFQSGVVEGALQLRGHTIPVLNGYQLLGISEQMTFNEMTRILVMQTDELFFGILVDEVREIIVAAEDMILSMPGRNNDSLLGVCQYTEKRNIMLLEVKKLLQRQLDKVKAMTKLRSTSEEGLRQCVTHHLITENCYLIFSIGKNYAIELRDVQEIIETEGFLSISDSEGLVQGVINLRGIIVPVLDLHQFYESPVEKQESGPVKLIIGHYGDQYVAMVVDEIVTIYKQEEFHSTPSLRPELQDKKDTLDRLIEFIGDDDLKEHVLVVNIKNILRNHLHLPAEDRGNNQIKEEEILAETVEK